MVIQIRPEFYCLEGEEQKTDVYKNRTRILIFGRIRSEFQCI